MNNRREILRKKKEDWNISKTLGIDILEVSKLDSDILEFKINWGSFGEVTPEKATEFSNKLNECISLVKSMNEYAISEDSAQ